MKMETAAMIASLVSSTMTLSAIAMSRARRRRVPSDQVTITIIDAKGRCEQVVARSGKRVRDLLRDVERAVHEA